MSAISENGWREALQTPLPVDLERDRGGEHFIGDAESVHEVAGIRAQGGAQPGDGTRNSLGAVTRQRPMGNEPAEVLLDCR